MVNFNAIKGIYESAKETNNYNRAIRVLHQFITNLEELRDFKQNDLIGYI